MSHEKNILPRNDKGQVHGLCFRYHDNGALYRRYERKNGIPVGYWEWYGDDGALWTHGNYINGNRDGLWRWYSDNAIINKEYYLK